MSLSGIQQSFFGNLCLSRRWRPLCLHAEEEQQKHESNDDRASEATRSSCLRLSKHSVPALGGGCVASKQLIPDKGKRLVLPGLTVFATPWQLAYF